MKFKPGDRVRLCKPASNKGMGGWSLRFLNGVGHEATVVGYEQTDEEWLLIKWDFPSKNPDGGYDEDCFEAIGPW